MANATTRNCGSDARCCQWGSRTLDRPRRGCSRDPQDRPTEHVEQRLILDFYEDDAELDITVFIAYPARTAAEAAAARDQTLDPEWHRPYDRLQRVHSAVADADETLARGETYVRHHEDSVTRTPGEPEHGWITLQYHSHWTNFVDVNEDLRIGQEFVDAFGPEWLVEVTYPTSWDPSTTNGDPHAGSDGPKGISQTWNLSDDPETPLIVFEGAEAESEVADSIPLGPAGGIGPAVLALVIVVLGATARRLRANE